MNNWTEKLKLLCVLATTKELISRSEKDGWPDEDPKEALQEIERVIDNLFSPEPKELNDYTRIMFAPTGPFQEISMSNGWSDAYLNLSEEYDKLAHLLK